MTTDPTATAVPLAPRALQETVAAGTSAPPRPDTVPVVEVAGYKLLDTLGTGAQGVVYRARHEKLGRDVALKTVLMPDRAASDVRARFEQEARALAQLQHPNVVNVFDTGDCARPVGFAYIAMELLTGETLDAVIARGALREGRAWLIARQVAAALGEADTHNIVHRDIKPGNLFVEPVPSGVPIPPDVGFVKVTDFGLALADGTGIGAGAGAAPLAVGTPVYMAPEQFAGGAVDRRADIYALGATVLHLRTGKVPFDGRSASEIAQQKALAPPTLSGGSEEEVALLKRMMARDPADRPQNYDELLKAIDALPCLAPVCALVPGSGRFKVDAQPAPPMPQPTPPGEVVPVTPAEPAFVAVLVPVPAVCPPEPVCVRTLALKFAGVLAIGVALGAGVAALFGAFGK
jgi:eukaryotic-like serine/threonine-protein kinase